MAARGDVRWLTTGARATTTGIRAASPRGPVAPDPGAAGHPPPATRDREGVPAVPMPPGRASGSGTRASTTGRATDDLRPVAADLPVATTAAHDPDPVPARDRGSRSSGTPRATIAATAGRRSRATTAADPRRVVAARYDRGPDPRWGPTVARARPATVGPGPAERPSATIAATAGRRSRATTAADASRRLRPRPASRRRPRPGVRPRPAPRRPAATRRPAPAAGYQDRGPLACAVRPTPAPGHVARAASRGATAPVGGRARSPPPASGPPGRASPRRIVVRCRVGARARSGPRRCHRGLHRPRRGAGRRARRRAARPPDPARPRPVSIPALRRPSPLRAPRSGLPAAASADVDRGDRASRG